MTIIHSLHHILIVPTIDSNNVTVFENVSYAVIQIERRGLLDGDILVNVTTVDGTALG